MQLVHHATATLLAQRGALIGWVPVCLGVGVGVYFSLRFEPSWFFVANAVLCAFVCTVGARFVHVACTPILIALALICAGLTVAKYRTETVAAPVLSFRYYGAIEGRIVGIDRSASDAVRLTLDRVRLDRFGPDRTPARVRISLHGGPLDVVLSPGQRIMTTGHLSPPSGPAEPGGFDFQRHAWFAQLGGVGYTRNPVLRAGPPGANDWRARVFAARMAVSNGVQATLPGEPGAFAAAIMSGDRSGMGQETLANLRASNLAHLLAISGLHMGLLTAVVFAALRTGLMLVPAVGLRVPAKKVAACGALVAAAGYLALSGGNVATERAFTMVAVMLIAILLGRPALSMRGVAIAAIIILILQPESLTGPGFQMSFAATTALVAVFGGLRKLNRRRLPRWSRGAVAVVTSSLVAGLATAPIAAAHFNQIAHYGLIANLLSVPLMGAVIMPAAVLAACLAPFGLAWIGLAIMGWGLQWILWVAGTVSAQSGAVSHVVTPSPWVLPCIVMGALIVILWQGRLRVAGLPLVALGFVLWTMTPRPAVLIADSGNLIGVMTPEGRALSRGTGSGFVASVWLENDGAPVPQEVAAARPGIITQGRVFTATLGGWKIAQVAGKTALAEMADCGGADVLVSNQVVEDPRPCLLLDVARLRQTGSVALDLTDAGDLQLRAARSETGARPWNQLAGDAPVLPDVIAPQSPRGDLLARRSGGP